MRPGIARRLRSPLILSALVVLLACPLARAVAEEKRPCPVLRGAYPEPRWTGILKLRSRAELPARLGQPVAIEWLSRAEAGRRGVPATCKKFLALADAEQLDLSDATDEQIARELTLRCRPLELLGRARPATLSFVRSFRLDQQPLQWLPPLNVVSSSAAEELKKKPVRWSRYEKGARVVASCTTRASIATSHDDTVVELVALGDFNGDGVEDVLLHVEQDFSRGGGTMNIWHLVLATRRRAGALLEVIRSW